MLGSNDFIFLISMNKLPFSYFDNLLMIIELNLIAMEQVKKILTVVVLIV